MSDMDESAKLLCEEIFCLGRFREARVPIDPEAIIRKALLTARNQGRDEGSAWPDEAEYAYGQPVEKFTGEAQWDGVIVSAYNTTAGKLRYVVEVKPQGFQMIAVPSQLRAALRKSQGERE